MQLTWPDAAEVINSSVDLRKAQAIFVSDHSFFEVICKTAWPELERTEYYPALWLWGKRTPSRI